MTTEPVTGRELTTGHELTTGRELTAGRELTTGQEHWRAAAACRDADPDLFFPVGTSGPALVQMAEAKRICLTCPVQTPCLAWALDHDVTDGVWGATTEDERRVILRQHRTVGRAAVTTVGSIPSPRPAQVLLASSRSRSNA
jgi:WhiB family transcriptional regulator, redox-sensing transcriptional regulator